jgi:hypothetical protein
MKCNSVLIFVSLIIITVSCESLEDEDIKNNTYEILGLKGRYYFTDIAAENMSGVGIFNPLMGTYWPDSNVLSKTEADGTLDILDSTYIIDVFWSVEFIENDSVTKLDYDITETGTYKETVASCDTGTYTIWTYLGEALYTWYKKLGTIDFIPEVGNDPWLSQFTLENSHHHIKELYTHQIITLHYGFKLIDIDKKYYYYKLETPVDFEVEILWDEYDNSMLRIH